MKKFHINKLLKIILAIVILIMPYSSNNTLVKAAANKLTWKYLSNGWTSQGGNMFGQAAAQYVDGEIAFCLDSRYLGKQGTNKTVTPKEIGISDTTLEKLTLIAWYGYRDKGMNDNNYALTQNAIWMFMNKDGQQYVNSSYPYKGSSMKKFYDDVMNKVNHFHDKTSFHAKTYTAIGDKPYTIKDTKKVLSGLRIKSVTGGKAKISGNDLIVTPDGKSKEVIVTFDRGMSAKQTKAKFIVKGTGKDEFGRPWQPVSNLTGADPYSSSVRIKVQRQGDLKIAKKDEAGEYVPNTSFKVSKNSDMSSALGTYKTGSDGTVTVKNLNEGKYYIQEVSVPNHLVLDKTIKSINVTAGKTTTFTMINNFKKGSIQIQKESANPSITNTNDRYKLEGAEYGIYSDKDGKSRVSTLVIGSDNMSNIVELKPSTYYVKETKAPEGYILNPSMVEVVVKANEKTLIQNGTFQDTPQSNLIDLALQKIDADSGLAKPIGNGSLKDAKFSFKFYEGNNFQSNLKHSREWIMKTDQEGKILMSQEYKVSGDDFYTNIEGKVVFPLGTIVIQEIEAPAGYKLNDEVFIQDITANGSAENIDIFNHPIVKENSVKLLIRKIQKGTDITISDVEFKHTLPDGTVELVKTNSKGEILLSGLMKGEHRLIETNVKAGYELNPNEVILNVDEQGNITLISKGAGIVFEKSDKVDGLLTIEDETSDTTLKIRKVNELDKLLDGAEFTIYRDAACLEPIETQVTTNGELQFNIKLENELIYYLKETKAPAGYRIPLENGNVHVYKIQIESIPEKNIFNVIVDDVTYTKGSADEFVSIEDGEKGPVITIKILNYTGIKLPNTGSNITLFLIGVGCTLMGLGIVFRRKYYQLKRKVEE